MFGKRSLVVLLVGLNLMLLAALLISSYSLPAAYAQGRGRSGDFVAVTAQALGQSYDVLYVLDVPERQLYAFYPQNTTTKQLRWTPPVDMKKAFEPQSP